MSGKRPQFKFPEMAFAFIFGDENHKQIAKRFGKSHGYVRQLSSAEEWPLYRKLVLTRAEQILLEEGAQEKAARIRRHMERWEEVEDKAFDALKAKDFDRALDALTALKTAVEGQRQAQGEPDQKVEHSGGVSVEFEVIGNGGDPLAKEDKSKAD